LPRVIDEPAYGEEVIIYTQQRLTLWLFLPAVTVALATLILVAACFPVTTWHVIYRLIIRLPSAKEVGKGIGVHTHLSLQVLRAVVAVLAGLGWLVAVGFFCVQFAEWRYSVYVLTNLRLVRRFVNFDWHNRGGIIGLRFQVIRKEVALRDVGEVSAGVLNGIRVMGRDDSLLMSITHIPRPALFQRSIEEALVTPLHTS
jgi:hypothetical protein